jgi:hypothetical protein
MFHAEGRVTIAAPVPSTRAWNELCAEVRRTIGHFEVHDVGAYYAAQPRVLINPGHAHIGGDGIVGNKSSTTCLNCHRCDGAPTAVCFTDCIWPAR